MNRIVLIALGAGLWGGGVLLADTVSPQPAAPEPTVVTSDRLNVDYSQNMGTFEGNVLVVDPKITVRADKIVVHFGENTASGTNTVNAMSRSLKRIEATGGVVISADDKKAVSEHAIYTAADGKVVLTGRPQVEGPDGTVAGDKITFWRDQKKMDVESSTRLILYPDEIKKSDAPAPAP